LISGKGPTHDYYGPSADSSGSRTFYQGDRIWNSRPEPGAPVGWVCVGSSSPCSWKSFGTVNDD
ncbi:hypothetical protein KJ708_05025, partial [bacterium]|nr:hypothetical protein [bacterium]